MLEQYLKERETTYHKRYIRLYDYILTGLSARRLVEAIDVYEECRIRYKDYSKLRQG